MSNKRLTAWIDRQEVLPVRAIPYVTGGSRFSPDVLAKRFTGKDSLDKNWNLRTYESVGGTWFAANSLMWNEVADRIQCFETQLKEQFPTRIAAYAVWWIGAVALLPAGAFVRLDEFRKTFQDYLDGVLSCGNRPTRDKLTLSPVMDANIRAMVMEGFGDIAEGNSGETDIVIISPLQRSFFHNISDYDPNESEVSRPALELSHDDTRVIDAELATAISVDRDISENKFSKSPVNKAETACCNPEQNDYTEQFAGLFDSVRVEALEKMFPADGKWKAWAERASANGLSAARTSRAAYNPYKAAMWFADKGKVGWDLAHCHRVLANNLPARSRDEKHLLTDYQD